MKIINNLKISDNVITHFQKVVEHLKALDDEVHEGNFNKLHDEFIHFDLIGCSRFESTLICMLKNSYVQQSQRYVKVQKDSFVKNPFKTQLANMLYNEYIDNTVELYNRMTELKPESVNKKRTTSEDYVYGIAIEDARGILPLATKTNISVSMNGKDLFDFLALLNQYKYDCFGRLFEEMYEYLKSIGCEYILERIKVSNKVSCMTKFTLTNELENEIEYKVYMAENVIDKIAIGTLMSTTANPLEAISKYPTKEDKINLINRVAGYGHTSILEQARFTTITRMSLSMLHQLVRHRHLDISIMQPITLSLASEKDVIYKLPEQIVNNVVFMEEFKGLLEDIKYIKNLLLTDDKEDTSCLNLLLLNCQEIELNITTNPRADIEVLNKRLCHNAQTDIKQFMEDRKSYMESTELGFLYKKFALPDCCLGGCKEGAYSCKKPRTKDFIYKK